MACDLSLPQGLIEMTLSVVCIYFYMIADEGFSESFNKCWQNIQMNFSFSHTVKLEKGR